MTIFSAIRGLTFLARDVFEAALYLIPAPGLSGYDVDGADLLAEREARVDVTEPWGECDCDCGLGPEPESISPFGPFAAPGPDGVVCAHGCDAWSISSDCRQHAGTRLKPEDDCCLGGDFPPAADDAPTPPDHPSYPQTNESNQIQIRADLLTAIQPQLLVAPLTADEVIAVRELLAERAHNAPVASASPPTPADATGSDPAAVHDRHMRRLLGEDQGRP